MNIYSPLVAVVLLCGIAFSPRLKLKVPLFSGIEKKIVTPHLKTTILIRIDDTFYERILKNQKNSFFPSCFHLPLHHPSYDKIFIPVQGKPTKHIPSM